MVEGYANKDHPALVELWQSQSQAAEVVKRALDLESAPELLATFGAGDVEVQPGIFLALRAIGRIRTQAETSANLGSDAPTMRADALHSLVWNAAAGRWQSAHYTDAVQRAATALSGQVKDRTGRYELGDSELMAQAFSLERPTEGKPRLRWPGNDSDLTVRAMRQGILQLSQGVFSAIRNPASHTTDEIPKQEALEQLATLSVLARWIDQCELVTA